MRNPVVKAGLCQLSYGYLRLLDKTVRLKTEFPAEMDRGMVAGFWHEDSLIMNLVLQRLAADRAGYSRAFSIKKRWDHYKIPLPFTTITVTAEKFGIVDRKSGEGKKPKNTLQSGI